MDRAAEVQLLAEIDAVLAMLDGSEWLLSADGERRMIDARGRDGSLVTIAAIDGKATPDEELLLWRALDYLRFLRSLHTRAVEHFRKVNPKQDDAPAAGKPKDHTTEAAMLCGDPAFKRFLMEMHGLDSPASDDRTAQKLRSVLGVTSRKDINESNVARERWLALRSEFKTWKGRAT